MVAAAASLLSSTRFAAGLRRGLSSCCGWRVAAAPSSPSQLVSRQLSTATEAAASSSPPPPSSVLSTAFDSSSPAFKDSVGAKKKKGELDVFGRAYATGRRKTSVARVWIKEGDGRFIINRREIHEYFGRLAYREKLVEPFMVTDTVGRFDVWCTVEGGGTTGQVGAISLGVSRALESFNAANRVPLAKESLLTRDSRRVERKKPGQPKARKKDQWVKR